MRRAELQFIKDTQEMELLFYDPSMVKNAQDFSGIMKSVKDHISGMYDPNNPVESFLSFMGPGILYTLGFPGMSIIFGIAQALGFDWTKFFVSIKEKLRPLITSLVNGGSTDQSTINSIIQDSAGEAATDNLNVEQLKEIVEKYSSLQNMLIIKKIAYRATVDDNFMHNIEKWLGKASGHRLRKGVMGFIIRLMSWVLTAALVSVGFAVAGGVVSHFVGSNKPSEKSDTVQNTNVEADVPNKSETKPNKQTVLVLNKAADPELFNTTFNDNNHVWLLNHNVNNIKNLLIQWAQELYPQLSNSSAFTSSSAFNNTLKLFQDRNKGAENLELLAVPQPFKSIKEIVDSFAADVVSRMN